MKRTATMALAALLILAFAVPALARPWRRHYHGPAVVVRLPRVVIGAPVYVAPRPRVVAAPVPVVAVSPARACPAGWRWAPNACRCAPVCRPGYYWDYEAGCCLYR